MIGSPVMLGALALLIFQFVSTYIGWRSLRNPMLLGIVAVLLLGALVVVYAHLGAFTERLGFGERARPEASVFVRLYAPVLFAYEVLAERPLFGFGLGASETVLHLQRSVLDSDLAPGHFFGRALHAAIAMHNSHAMLLAQLGVVGSITWLILWHFTAKALARGSMVFFWLFYTMFGMAVGSFHAPVFWGSVVIVLAAMRLRAKSVATFPGRILN